MIRYQNQTFFLVPTALTKEDTEFNIFNASGEVIGTTVQGISKGSYSEEEKDKLENFLIDESLKLEAELKFQKEFNLSVSQSSMLDITADRILDIMYKKWSIPMEVMDDVLGTYL